MENLFNQTQYQKRHMMYKVSDLEDICTSSTASDNSKLIVNKVGDTEHMQIIMSDSGDNPDDVTIAGRCVDVLGSVSDENIAQSLGMSFSELTKDFLDTVRKAIWKYNQVINKKTTEPVEPTVPTEPTVPEEPEDPDPNPEWIENEEEIADYTGVQKAGYTYTGYFSSKPTVLTLENPFTGTNYQYQISSNTINAVNATFTYLENGRLLVKGDNLKIVAKSGQKDDIIVLGNYNEVLTGDEDDTVRVGMVIDNNYEDYYLKNGVTASTSYTLTDGTLLYTAVGNKVDTGDGNDYVTMFGDNYSVNMGSGSKDKFLSLQDNIETQNVTGAEKITTQYNTESIADANYLDGWVLQGSNGDCRLLSVINSFCGNTNEGNIKDKLGVSITKSGNYVTVKFNRYNTSRYGGTNTVTFSVSELDNFDGAYGDVDTILIDIALNKLIAKNAEYESYLEQFKSGDDDLEALTVDTCVADAAYNTIARYLTGSSEITYLSNYDKWKGYENDYLTYEKLLDCWHMYQSGTISNISIGITETDYSLGIIGGHAYSLKNIDEEYGYIELVNPWDDADVLRIPVTSIFNDYDYFTIDLVVYGDDIYNQKVIRANGGYPVYIDNSNPTNTCNMPAIKMSSENKTNNSIAQMSQENLFTKTDDNKKEIQAVENDINRAKAIFSFKKNFGEMLS